MGINRHLVVIDPIAFAGGSKVATENILRLLDKQQIRITVLSADAESWQWENLKRVQLFEPRWLAKQQQGIPYFLRHLFIAFNLLITRLRFGKIDVALGASGPGVDLSLYLIKPLLGFNITQLVHGPVACSRTIGRCLKAANKVHYLESSSASLIAALSRVTNKNENLSDSRYQIMKNGLSEHNWPQPCQYTSPVIFWAASLLKWKGLETLIDALDIFENQNRPKTHICYIQPKQTSLPVSRAPVTMESVYWHAAPNNLDEIRSNASIFVSTSYKEPFGLSILEAMTSGHCVVIPADGAYWDQILTHGVNCIKYEPGNAIDLAANLFSLSNNMIYVMLLGSRGASLALEYRATTQYQSIKNNILGITEAAKTKQPALAQSKITP